MFMLSAAVERNVRVELLMSEWDHTRPSMFKYLQSLQQLDGLTAKTHIRYSVSRRDIVMFSYENINQLLLFLNPVLCRVRMFRVPAFTPEQERIPFGRVNHNKYLVTETTGFVGTSNWSADYFISTGGIGFIFSGPLRDDLNEIFLRDWNSSYARNL